MKENLNKELLVESFFKSVKPKKDWRIGTEHEKFGFKKKSLEPINALRRSTSLADIVVWAFAAWPSVIANHAATITCRPLNSICISLFLFKAKYPTVLPETRARPPRRAGAQLVPDCRLLEPPSASAGYPASYHSQRYSP